MFRHRAACPAVCLAVILVLIGCSLSGDDPVGPSAVVVPPDKLLCPDLDGDEFSTNVFCTEFDCNDQWDFISGDGYCETLEYLEYDPYEFYGRDVADFCLYEGAGLIHLFFTTGSAFESDHSLRFEHVVSVDGEAWWPMSAGLTVDPDSDWDDTHLWAPCVVHNPGDNLYYMFYTGVTDGGPAYHHEERIGVATSPDLWNWHRVDCYECTDITSPGCVLDADLPWTGWNGGGLYAHQCRDPFVFRGRQPGTWYMVYSTVLAGSSQMVVGLARSTDLIAWIDCGPISVTAGNKVESAHVHRVGPWYYLFWTVHGDGGIRYTRTTTLEGGQWAPAAYLSGSDDWIASETLIANNRHFFAYIREPWRQFRLREFATGEAGEPTTGGTARFDCGRWGAENVYPGAEEVTNGVDDNCNGLVDETGDPCSDQDGDGYGDPASVLCPKQDRDCDDGDPDVHPHALGVCENGIDDDCDGWVDDPDECRRRFDYISRY